MTIGMWILCYAGFSLLFKWMISWGGAEKVEGWIAGLSINLVAWDWTVEQLRLYALASWVVLSIFFVLGLWFPEWRGLGMVL